MQTHESQPKLLLRLVIVLCVCVLAVAACASIPSSEPAALIMVILFVGWPLIIALGLKPRSWNFVKPSAPKRRPRVRLSVRGMMYMVGGCALVLWPARYACQSPPDPYVPDYHGMMAFFCEEEAKLFQSRADACLARAKNGTPWDDSGEDSEVLKLCPYPSDQRSHDSWLEQAGIWERASARARWAARRHVSHL
jgi:hypothetical protein